MAGRTLPDIWRSAAGFPYYRPLGFTAWRLLQLLFGETNTVAHHALNLLVLVFNGWLLGALAMRLAADRAKTLDAGVYAWSSGAILTAFPFAALAVPLVASLFHLFVALLALAAGVSFLEYIQHGRRRWAVIAVVCAVLGPFVHESGVAVSGMLAILWMVAPVNTGKPWWSSARRRGGAVVLAALVTNLLFVLLWSNIPKMRTGGNLPGGLQANELWLNAVFFIISLTFPLQPWALNAQLNWDWLDVTAVLVFGGLALVVAFFLARRAGMVRWLLAGTGYAAVAAVPAILTLPFLYVIVSPRLMVLGAPGVALLWGSAVAALVRLASHRITQSGGLLALAGLAIAALLAVPIRHIVAEVQLHQRALAPVEAMVQAIEAAPDERHLIVNPTTWLARVEVSYPIVHEGVVVFPEYVSPAQLAAIHLGAEVEVEGVAFPPIYTEPREHYFDVWGPLMDWESLAARIRAVDHIWLVTYGDGPLQFARVGQKLEGAATSAAPIATFAAKRVSLESAAARLADGAIELTLDWNVREPTGEEVFAHALDCSGTVLGLADGPPVGRMFPFWLWQANDRFRDTRFIPLDALSGDGCYQVEVGLFNPADGSRPEAFDAAGQRLEKDALYLVISSQEK